MNIRELRIKHAKGMCEYCGHPGSELHHVFGGRGKRKDLESFETVVWLCSECHRGKFSPKVINHFKVKVSTIFLKQYGQEKARKMCGGRLYF
jgi:5-methylcytosine-specific restriction endonuclease McrA